MRGKIKGQIELSIGEIKQVGRGGQRGKERKGKREERRGGRQGTEAERQVTGGRGPLEVPELCGWMVLSRAGA